MSRREKRRKLAAQADAEDREEGVKQRISSSIRSAKKAALPKKMTVVREAGSGSNAGVSKKKGKKGKKGGGFDREIGQAGSGKGKPKRS